MGFCHSKLKGGWVEVSDSERRARLEINWVSIRIHHDEESGEILPLPCVILTLLHELAHTATESVQRKSRENGKSSRRFRPDDHGTLFYTSFRTILEAAEELHIFKLPSAADKYSMRSLARFDNLDSGAPAMISSGSIGKALAAMMMTASGADDMENRALETKRITVTFGMSSKVLLLHNYICTMPDLIKIFKAKFHVKASNIRLRLADREEDLTSVDQLSHGCHVLMLRN